MKHILLAFLLFFSVGLLQANDKKVIIKKMVVSSDQNEQNVDVNVEVENDQLTLTINKDGEENVFKVNLQDDDALKALKEEIEALGVDVNIMGLVDGDEDHEIMFFGDDYDKFSFEPDNGGYLGVQIQDLTDQLRDYFKVKGDGGVLVSEVVKNSPAEKAGLEAGDVIMTVNDVRISDTRELTQTIRSEKPDNEVDITVVRKGREKSLKATLGSSGDSFSWLPKIGGLHKMELKPHKKMMKKLGHVCTADCGDNCPLKGQLKLDIDLMIPDGASGMMKNKFFFPKGVHGDDLEKLKKELEELRKEIQKLKES